MPFGGNLLVGILVLVFFLLAVMWFFLPFILYHKLERIITELCEIRNRLPEQPKSEPKPEPTGPFAKMRG
jgi:hypothetical protein